MRNAVASGQPNWSGSDYGLGDDWRYYTDNNGQSPVTTAPSAFSFLAPVTTSASFSGIPATAPTSSLPQGDIDITSWLMERGNGGAFDSSNLGVPGLRSGSGFPSLGELPGLDDTAAAYDGLDDAVAQLAERRRAMDALQSAAPPGTRDSYRDMTSRPAPAPYGFSQGLPSSDLSIGQSGLEDLGGSNDFDNLGPFDASPSFADRSNALQQLQRRVPSFQRQSYNDMFAQSDATVYGGSSAPTYDPLSPYGAPSSSYGGGGSQQPYGGRGRGRGGNYSGGSWW